tara:strand:- start:418 stop:549 length:132 start_codon:yes stop_codon:yes gene_type:complete
LAAAVYEPAEQLVQAVDFVALAYFPAWQPVQITPPVTRSVALF